MKIEFDLSKNDLLKMDTLKCYICKRTQAKTEFHTFKSCQSCRKKKTSKKELLKEPIKESIPIETFAKSIESINHVEAIRLEKVSKTEWCILSGKWIRKGEEQRLHKILLKKVHRQFMTRCMFPVHKYLTKYLMVDIRDV